MFEIVGSRAALRLRPVRLRCYCSIQADPKAS